MTTIGGPGGIGGPKGPTSPDGAEPALHADDLAGEVALDPTYGPAHAAATTAPGALEALGAELAAGRLTPREATAALIDHLVETTGGPTMDAAERAELRELLTDLVTNDPYLAGLVGRL